MKSSGIGPLLPGVKSGLKQPLSYSLEGIVASWYFTCAAEQLEDVAGGAYVPPRQVASPV